MTYLLDLAAKAFTHWFGEQPSPPKPPETPIMAHLAEGYGYGHEAECVDVFDDEFWASHDG